jgi:hypothetical protein
MYVGDSITGAEILRRGRALTATAAAVTAAAGGAGVEKEARAEPA